MAEALDQLIRLHSWKLDEKRREAADLERLAERLRNEIGALDAELVREREAAGHSVELQRVFPSYAKRIQERRARLEKSMRDVEGEIERVRAEITDAYQELKTYEQVSNNRIARRQAVLRRREQIASDEIGLSMFRRRQ